MSFIGSFGAALARLDRRLSGGTPGYGVIPLSTQSAIELPNEAGGGSRLISHDDVVQSNPVVWGVWRKVLHTLATTGIVIEQQQRDGRWVKVHDHDIERVLSEPADGFGLVDTLSWLFNPYLVEGNGLLAKYREEPKGPPTSVLPLDWRYMSAWARPGGPVELWGTQQTGEQIPLVPSEVVHLTGYAPTFGAIGVSPLTALGTAVRVDNAASRILEAQYNNGLMFGGFLSFPKDLPLELIPDGDAMDAMKKRWQDAYGGVDNAFKVAILQGGLQYEKVSQSVADAELMKARDVSADDVYRGWGMRRSDFEDAGQGVTVEDRQRSLHRSLIPHAELAQSALNRQLVAPEAEWAGFRVRLDLSGLLRGTWREETEQASFAFTNGLISRNEARERIGYAPDDDPESNKLLRPHSQLAAAGEGRDNRTLPTSDRTQPGRDTPEIPDAGDGAG